MTSALGAPVSRRALAALGVAMIALGCLLFLVGHATDEAAGGHSTGSVSSSDRQSAPRLGAPGRSADGSAFGRPTRS